MRQANKSAKEIIDKADALRRAGKVQQFIDLVVKSTRSRKYFELAPITQAAILLKRNGNLKTGLELLAYAAEHHPANKDAIENYARAVRESGDLRLALELFKQANQLEESAQTHNSIGVCYYELRQSKQAVLHYQAAAKLDPKLPDCWANMGNALKDLHKTHDAVRALEHSLELKPDYAWAMSCLSHLKQRLTLQEEAVRLADSALDCDRQNAEMWLTSLMVRLPLAPKDEREGTHWLNSFSERLSELENWASYDENLKNLGERVGYSQPYYIAYRPGNHQPILSKYGALLSSAAQAMRGFSVRPSKRKFTHGEKIKLGIISGFLFRHSVWDIILKGFVLNRSKNDIELHVFYTGSTVDDQTEIARRSADFFYQGPHPHKKWIDIVTETQLDAILYPEIGMDPYSMHLACLRLAPLQINSWGHPMTSGLPTLDWYLSGDILEPEDGEKHYSEKLIRLPGTGVCTHKLEIKPKLIRFEANGEINLTEYVKFYVCQHAFKINDDAIELLSNIVKSVDKSLLVVVADNKYPEAFNIALGKLKKKLNEKVINGDKRLYLLPWMSREQFLGSFAGVDIYLDLPGFSGYTTAWQAVSQGIPIVTLQGKHLRQRLAAGVLQMVGETEGISGNFEEYLFWCQKLASEYHTDKITWQNRRQRLHNAYELLDGKVSPVRRFEELLNQHFERSPNPPVESNATARSEVKRDEKRSTPTKALRIEEAESILISQQSDLNAAISHPVLKRKQMLFFCPQLMDSALGLGLDNSALIQPTLDVRAQQRSLSKIHVTSKLIDLTCEEVRKKAFGGSNLAGWDAQLVSFFLARLEIVKNVSAALSTVGHINSKTIVLRSEDPQIFYFDGEPTSKLIAQGFSDVSTIIAYRSQRNIASPYTQLFDPTSWATSGDEVFVHIPTCFHHKARFESWIRESTHDSFIRLPATHWDVKLDKGHEASLTPIGNGMFDKYREAAKSYAKTAINVYRDLLNQHLSLDIMSTGQEQYFIDQLTAQAIQYLSLRSSASMKGLIISDHDVGYNGPLHSAAADQDAPICVLPHSEVTDTMKFIPSGLASIVQDVSYRSNPKSITGATLKVHHREIRKTPQLISGTRQKKGRKICLLLNSLNTNLSCYTNIRIFAEFYRKVCKFAADSDWSVLVRVKPSGAPLNVLGRLLGISPHEILKIAQLPLEEIADESAICVSYGEPTSAITEFLYRGALIVSTWDQEMPCEHWDELSLRPHIVHPSRVEESLLQIRQYILDSAKLEAEMQRQQQLFQSDIASNHASDTRNSINPIIAAMDHRRH